MEHTIEEMKKDKYKLEQAVTQLVNEFSNKYAPRALDFDLLRQDYFGMPSTYVARIATIL